MKETVIQFGEGNFLRGFADWFIDEMNKSGLYDGRVTIIKPTPRGNCDKFNEQECRYNLFLRGIENGSEVCRHSEINSVSRIINPYEDWQACLELARSKDIRFVISNTTEAGIVFDNACKADDAPPSSFPAKLTLMLYERYKAGLDGLVILPCELIDNNAGELKKCVLEYIALWSLGEDFASWIQNENAFCNTLVDRIVTGYPKEESEELCRQIGYEDKLLDTAEIYHLWVIEGDYEAELPLKKAGFNVIWTDNASPYKKRKVRVLNGAHTSMVFPALIAGIETVGDCMKDDDISAFMHECVYGKILRVIGETDDNREFAMAVEERFKNPYIRHQLSSIALNSISKFAVRVLPSILDYKELYGEYPLPLVFSLSALIYYYKNSGANDEKSAQDFVIHSSVDDILKNTELWGSDLSELAPIVKEGIRRIESDGIREAIRWSL